MVKECQCGLLVNNIGCTVNPNQEVVDMLVACRLSLVCLVDFGCSIVVHGVQASMVHDVCG
jgi:hypothetical protein